MRMTWGEWKAAVEAQGLTDEHVLDWIDWGGDMGPPEVRWEKGLDVPAPGYAKIQDGD